MPIALGAAMKRWRAPRRRHRLRIEPGGWRTACHIAAATAMLAAAGACSWPDYAPVRDWGGAASGVVDYAPVATTCSPPRVDGSPAGARSVGVAAMQEALSTYLRALAVMADDGVLPYREDPYADHLAPRTAAVSEAGGRAVAALGTLLRKVSIKNAQAPQLADTIKEADGHVQALVSALTAALPPATADAPDRTAAAEAYAALEEASHDPAARQAIRDVAALRDREFATREASRVLYARALAQVAEGHALLKERASHLSQQETARQVRAAQDRLARTAAPLPRTLAGSSIGIPCPPPPLSVGLRREPEGRRR
jgi:hypothetical protein